MSEVDKADIEALVLPVEMIDQTLIESPQAEQSASFRKTKIVAKAGAILLGGMIGAGIATNVVPNHVTLGPVEASVKIVPSNVNTVSLVGDETLKATQKSQYKFIGAEVKITNLNTDLSYLSKTSSTESSAFTQLFSNLDHDKKLAVQKIERRAAMGAASGAALASAAVFGIPYVRRRHAHEHPDVDTAWNTLNSHYGRRIAITSGIAAGCLVVAGGVYVTHQITQPIKPDASFQTVEGLTGTQLTGSAAPLIRGTIERVSNIINGNAAFYKTVQENLRTQFTERYAETLPSGKNIVPIMIVSDRHCNVGMDPVLAEQARLFKAQMVIDAGDSDFSGTYPFEFACTSGFATFLAAQKIPLASVLGNHDSTTTSDPGQNFNTEMWEKNQGIHVLNNDIQSFKLADGTTIRLTGNSDPRRSRLGSSIQPSGETEQQTLVTEQGEALGKLACESKDIVDIVVAHDPRASESALQTGCNNIKLAISGHTHVRQAPIPYDSTTAYRMVEGTSGGAKEGTPTFGPLKAPAVSDILYYNTETRELTGSVTITALSSPNGDVELGSYIPLNSSNQPGLVAAGEKKKSKAQR